MRPRRLPAPAPSGFSPGGCIHPRRGKRPPSTTTPSIFPIQLLHRIVFSIVWPTTAYRPPSYQPPCACCTCGCASCVSSWTCSPAVAAATGGVDGDGDTGVDGGALVCGTVSCGCSGPSACRLTVTWPALPGCLRLWSAAVPATIARGGGWLGRCRGCDRRVVAGRRSRRRACGFQGCERARVDSEGCSGVVRQGVVDVDAKWGGTVHDAVSEQRMVVIWWAGRLDDAADSLVGATNEHRLVFASSARPDISCAIAPIGGGLVVFWGHWSDAPKVSCAESCRS